MLNNIVPVFNLGRLYGNVGSRLWKKSGKCLIEVKKKFGNLCSKLRRNPANAMIVRKRVVGKQKLGCMQLV